MKKLFGFLLFLGFGLNVEASCRLWGSPPPYLGGCGIEQTIRNEGVCLCCYYDTDGIPTIGIDFNLHRPDAASLMRRYGLKVTDVRRDCIFGTTNHCLTNAQAYDLFRQKVYPNFSRLVEVFVPSMPTDVHAAVIDVAFGGYDKLNDPARFPNFRQHLQKRDYKAAADVLRNTEWCRAVPRDRCSSNVICVGSGV